MLTAFITRVLAASDNAHVVSGGAADKPNREATAIAVKKALAFLARRVDEIDEPYLIASYALAAFDARERSGAARAVEKLRALSHDEGACTYWALETNTPFYGWGLAGRIETTALVLQALAREHHEQARVKDVSPQVPALQRTDQTGTKSSLTAPTNNRTDDALISRGLVFLLRNKDRYGVWHSTQATVNVLDALISLTRNRAPANQDDRDENGGTPTNDSGALQVVVNNRVAATVTLPSAGQLSNPLVVDLSPYLTAPGANRVELRRSGGPAASPQTHAQIVSTYYVPWKGRVNPARESSISNGSTALKLHVHFNKTQVEQTEEVTCSVSVARIGHSGYGMLLAEIGLPPGADVDRQSLERAMEESGWSISHYDVLPDRLVVYLWPQGGGTKFDFKFRPRFGLNAQSAPSLLYDYYNPEARAVVPPVRFVVR